MPKIHELAKKQPDIFRYLSKYNRTEPPLQSLRDPTRRRILEMLKERDLTVTEISAAFEMSTPSISYHLDLLKHAQLASAREKGQFVTYTLETTVLDESLGWILDLIKTKKGKRK